jgi:AMP phosphorylase
MRFIAKTLDFEAGGKGVVIMNRRDAEELGLHALDRVEVHKNHLHAVAIVDVAEKFARPGEVITNHEINRFLSLKKDDSITLCPAAAPESVAYIKKKIAGTAFTHSEAHSIVTDVVHRHLTDIELSAFVTALDAHGMSMDEVEALSKAMIATGKQLKIPGRPIVDKHSAGGIPGDKTSLLAVPIVASAGLVIPKTSSRAITSPAGTADRMEVLAPVTLSADDIVRIVKKTKGCLAWGGALDLAPADDAFIKIEYPLGIDPLLLPSIMSKKKAVGAQYVVIDLPTGRGAKIKTIGSAQELSGEFIELGRRLGMNVACAITFGEQPLGYCIGPALEAQEALLTLQGKGPSDLVDKVTSVVGLLFEMVGSDSGKKRALHLLNSGKAEKKMREIIGAQGGDSKVRPSDIKIGSKTADIIADHDGRVLWMTNTEIAAIAKEAGAPKEKGAGIRLHHKIGSPVKKGEKLFTIYSENAGKLECALKRAKELTPVMVGKSLSERMLMSQIPSKLPVHRRVFMLER